MRCTKVFVAIIVSAFFLSRSLCLQFFYNSFSLHVLLQEQAMERSLHGLFLQPSNNVPWFSSSLLLALFRSVPRTARKEGVRVWLPSTVVDVDESTTVQQGSTSQQLGAEDAHSGTEEVRTNVTISGREFEYRWFPRSRSTTTPAESQSVLVGILSNGLSKARRQLLRTTWADVASPVVDVKGAVRVVYIVAGSFSDVADEYVQKRDLIFLDLVEEYTALTSVLPFKSQTLFHAANSANLVGLGGGGEENGGKNSAAGKMYYSHVLKTDDDVYLNLREFLLVLRKRQNTKKDKFFGFVWPHSKVNRDPEAKWYTPHKLFSENYFPPYCSGAGYVLGAGFLKCLAPKLGGLKHMPREDVATGILAKACGVQPSAENRIWVGWGDEDDELMFSRDFLHWIWLGFTQCSLTVLEPRMLVNAFAVDFTAYVCSSREPVYEGTNSSGATSRH